MRAVLWILACVPLIAGCGSSSEEAEGMAGWSGLPNAYATRFEIQVRGDERRVVVFGPKGRVDTVGIYPYRTEGGGSGGRSLDRVVVLSTTHLSYFGALGAVDQVVGTAFTGQVRDPRFGEAVRRGRLQEVSRADGVDRERLLALDPQLVFDYPFGGGDRRSEGLPSTVYVTEYLEEHPLGRAEWVRFFGALLNEERRADSAFKAIEHRYTVLREMKAHLMSTPTVLFASHWNGAWFAPPGNSYMATLINDAGGRYIYSDSMVSGNINLPLERLLVIGDSIDHLGVLLAAAEPVDRVTLVGGDPRVARLKCVREGAFLGNSSTDDIFGAALLEPDEVLRDLRCIFHPGSCAGRKGRYFRAMPQ